MKTRFSLLIALLAFAACNNSEQVQRLKDLANKDSLLLLQTQQKDSTISNYLGALNDIQNNLDRIKMRERIITFNSGELKGTGRDTMLNEIKEIDQLIIRNDRKINILASRLKKANVRNDTLENIISHLYREIAAKDEEIMALQAKLSQTSDSLRVMTIVFNDSIIIIKKQRAEVFTMKTQMNTVFYITGTMKQLQDKEVVDKNGGLIGMGSVALMNPDVNGELFTKANLTTLHGIALNGKFRRLVTVHPDGAYMISTSGKTDSLIITNPSSFWSESKYLVVATK